MDAGHIAVTVSFLAETMFACHTFKLLHISPRARCLEQERKRLRARQDEEEEEDEEQEEVE